VNSSTFVKYIAVGILLASIFALVLIGKVDVELYVGIVIATLAALGVHTTMGGSLGTTLTGALVPFEPLKSADAAQSAAPGALVRSVLGALFALGMLGSLTACGVFTGNPAVDFSPATIQANLATFNAWASKIATDANADVSVLAAEGLPAICTAVGVLDADLDTAALVSTKVAAVQAQSDQVATAFTKSAACTGTPPTDVAGAVASGVNAAAQIQAALKSDPTVVAAPPAPAQPLVPTPTPAST
jgi:hypothetical protein